MHRLLTAGRHSGPLTLTLRHCSGAGASGAAVARVDSEGRVAFKPAAGAAVPAPKANELAESDLRFDEVTHTGQAWDQADRRLARFTLTPKAVNPNVAMRLVAEIAPVPSKARVVSCDGGGGALGHPKVYINLDQPGNHACGYCGMRFTKAGQPHDGAEHISV